MSKKHPWLPEEIDMLRTLYPNHTAKFAANVLGREAGCIYRKAYELGLEKSDDFWKSDRSGQVQRGQQDPRMQATQFKKGHTSWNKGTKGIQACTPAVAPRSSRKGAHQKKAATTCP